MAAKSSAGAKGRKGAVAKATGKRGRPKGLQLSRAQAAAYNKAFSATAQRLSNAAALKARATGFRKYRLQAARATIAKASVYRARAQAASVAAHAASMSLAQSKQAHQNAALVRRVGMEAQRHTTLLGRAQFAEAGTKKYAQRAVMRTVTQKQAVSHEMRFFNKVAKNAKAAGKRRGRPRGRRTPLSKVILAAAKRAGSAAAARVPAPTQAAKAQNRRTNARNNASSAKAPAKAAKTRTAPMINWAAAAAAHAQAVAASGTAPPVKKTVPHEWLGDEVTPNCVIVAIANHLLLSKGIKATEADLKTLTEDCGPKPVIEEVLWKAWLTGWPASGKVRLTDYRAVELTEDDYDPEFAVIGFEVLTDDGWRDHCALSLKGNQVVSWGNVRDREAPVEEAWNLTWGA